ncbi:DUF3010 family protein [Dasania sp. GY-MA-18]|uniref:DUF3010 family protein n=1 Tax=Dasania phycosphaerae TaxID=2950436 RepID=A0A9J6RK42_9GAMM|nr:MULTISPECIES: DUF3010 family protein [Dasania]MCR8922350.1 DUF3010 family protein [Dasania sp. GY-MA-18]MCZ0864778.1 DUF3010 family protein [Dasania phycosphaerae]MCZ0868506.1 DUF3010 family protein [Dasania phycosphaerae]
MRVCGVELTTSEANICLLGQDKGVFEVADCRQRVFTLAKTDSTTAIREFQFSFKKLMEDYKVDEVVIIERAPKGKLAGSAISFKLEAAIQLIDIPVTLMNYSTMKELIKNNKVAIDFNSLGLKKFQQAAFNVAYAYQNQLLYPEKP